MATDATDRRNSRARVMANKIGMIWLTYMYLEQCFPSYPHSGTSAGIPGNNNHLTNHQLGLIVII